MMNKRNLVVDDNDYGLKKQSKRRAQSKAKPTQSKAKPTQRKAKPTQRKAKEDSVTELDILLQQQRLKEKQLLLQWKAVRETEKKIRSIVRGQSRDAVAKGKECFTKIDGSYESIADTESHYVWKHDGCSAACKADNCQQWMIEYLC
jgi:hypothetical protein